MSTEVTVRDPAALSQAIDGVRSDDNEVNWALFGHVDGNPNEICAVGSGTGGVVEMMERLEPTEVMYGFLRFVEMFDMSASVKFVCVKFFGNQVPFAKKGKFGVVSGAVENALQKAKASFHLSMTVSTREEVSEEIIRQLLREQSGTQNKVLEVDEGRSRPERGFTSSATKGAGSKSSGYTGQGVQKVATGGGAVTFDEEVLRAVKSVRNDGSEIEWCVASYKDDSIKNPIVLLGEGSSHEEFASLFKENAVTYALYRVTDLVDNIPTVKFAFISWIGDDSKPMYKAKASTHKGAVEDQFGAVHCKLHATLKGEISQRVIFDKISSTSGSKSRVK